MPHQTLKRVLPAYGVFRVALVLLLTLGAGAQLFSAPLGLAITEGLIVLVAFGYIRLTGQPLPSPTPCWGSSTTSFGTIRTTATSGPTTSTA